MTIAAGLICSNGIILCADSEQSDGESKYQHEKIFSSGNSLILTGSGTVPFIKMAFDKICDEYKTAVPADPSDARDILEKVIMGIHVDHIFKFYAPNDLNRPYIELLVAKRCCNGKLALIKTSDSAAYLSDSYEVTGMGQSMFEYWASYLYRSNLDMDSMSYLAIFMLREAKKSKQNCGGWSRVAKMPNAEFKGPLVANWFDENRILADFPESVTRILSVCMDFSVTNGWLEDKLKEFSDHVMAVREAERNAKDMRDKVKVNSEGRLEIKQ